VIHGFVKERFRIADASYLRRAITNRVTPSTPYLCTQSVADGVRPSWIGPFSMDAGTKVRGDLGQMWKGSKVMRRGKALHKVATTIAHWQPTSRSSWVD
jgi:hypothetical protein